MFGALEQILDNNLSNLLNTIKSPEELLEWMFKHIQYGWVDKNKVRTDFAKDFSDKYHLMSPQEVFKYKCGLCEDQAFFSAKFFRETFKIPYKLLFVQQYYVSTHTFLIFKKNDHWYHFENSFARMQGIHGPYSGLENGILKIVEDVHTEMAKMIEADKELSQMRDNYLKKNKDKQPYKFLVVPEDKLNPEKNHKITIDEYLTKCEYDFNKQEHTY